MFSTFPHVNDYLNSLVNFEQAFPLGGTRDRPKLQPTLDAVGRMGLSRSLPGCAHIAGTVGKGSVACYLEAMLSRVGRTISFTSPHLESVKERVQMNGEQLDDELWCEGFNAIVEEIGKQPKIKLTYFESVWVFYLWLSRRVNASYHVVETGLGGKWDATNVLTNSVPVFTTIDLDHTGVLGNTIEEIARDKCGIIKASATVVSTQQAQGAAREIVAECKRKSATLSSYGSEFETESREGERFCFANASQRIDSLTLKTPGQFQRENAALAVQAALTIGPYLTEDQIRDGLNSVRPSGRQQLLTGTPKVLVDVAHNPIAFRELAARLADEFANAKIVAVAGLMKVKDVRECLRALRGCVNQLIAVTTGNPRSCEPKMLCKIAQEFGIEAVASDSQYSGFELLHDTECDLGIVTGSFYVAGAYLTWRRDAGVA